MFNTCKRHRIPALNTTSTADISFMLLTFFLVTTSMDSDRGLPRQLPPIPKTHEEREVSVSQRNVMNVSLDANDRLTCDDKEITLEQLKAKVKDFVVNPHNSATLPEKHFVDIPLLGKCAITDKHVISIQADAHTSYDAYFKLQNTIVMAYARLRNNLAMQRFGHSFRECSASEREAIMKYYPQRISEAEPTHNTNKGGEQ